MSSLRVIAFYLPQYHPTKENDIWWGKGFTEWTNVGKAVPLYKGHYQPHVPADLGYYDLRIPEVRHAQADLARRAGIEGFCYWHYWFGNGDRLLERVFDEVLESGEPDFPFCLGWANHSWYKKTWDKEGTDELLKEQKYPGPDDYRHHFNYAYKAFCDERYMRHDNKPIFYVFDAEDVPVDFMQTWQVLAKEHGLDGICFIGRIKDDTRYQEILDKGFSFLTAERTNNISTKANILVRRTNQIRNILRRRPRNCYRYEDAYPFFINAEYDVRNSFIPCLVPNWDHSPRSGRKAFMLHGATPELFAEHVREVFDLIKNKPEKDRIVFLKSWNEWGEGNYLEPDLKWGTGFIDTLRAEIDRFNNNIY